MTPIISMDLKALPSHWTTAERAIQTSLKWISSLYVVHYYDTYSLGYCLLSRSSRCAGLYHFSLEIQFSSIHCGSVDSLCSWALTWFYEHFYKEVILRAPNNSPTENLLEPDAKRRSVSFIVMFCFSEYSHTYKRLFNNHTTQSVSRVDLDHYKK